MGYRLRMSGEIHDWLTELAGSDPASAMLVGQALTALLGDGAEVGPPLVISLADRPGLDDLPEALDLAYQDRLDSFQAVRRRVADVAMLRHEIEHEIAQLESLRDNLADQHLEALDADRADEAARAASESAAADDLAVRLRRLLPGVIQAQHQLLRASRRHQAQIDAFRTRAEILTASYTVEHAEHLVDQAIAASGADTGADAGHGSVRLRSSDGLDAGAASRLREIRSEMERELGKLPSAAGLKELRAGAAGDSDIRILFAVEPPGTALLISVLEGADAVRDSYRDAVRRSAEVLRSAQAGEAPEAAAHAFGDAESFLDEFFAGTAGEVAAGAAALAARNRARTLAEQRTRLGLTQAEVARRMGVRQERVSAIERAEPGATEVRTLASYVEALGGRLDIVADFGPERILLR